MAEHTLWERGVAGSSPVIPIQGGDMKFGKHDIITWIFFVVVAIALWFTITRYPEESLKGLEGGNIQAAIDTKQF